MAKRHRRIPRYTARGWQGGDSRTLYAVVDRRTGDVTVRPGEDWKGIGPEVDVSVATKQQAEDHWQKPLNKGWKVRGEYEIGADSPEYKKLLLRVTSKAHLGNFESDSLQRAIGRAYKAFKIDDEERDLLATFLDARRG